MSFETGWSAIHLEMPDRVPRTEYSADGYHHALVRRVTGLPCGADATPEQNHAAMLAFRKAWTYDLNWCTLIGDDAFGSLRTDMGHADYAENGTDFRPQGKCPFEDPEDVLALDFEETYPLPSSSEMTRRFTEQYRNNVKMLPDEVNMTGTYVTLMSGLISILGWDMLLYTCGTDREGFGRLADRYANWMMHYMEALADCEAPVVMIHDDIVWTAGPFIHPDWYRKYIFPNYKRYFAPILESGKKILFTSDGCYTPFLNDLAGTGLHGFALEPMTDMKAIAERFGKTHVFIGNADTRILLLGTPEDIRNEVRRCMDIGKSCPGFFMAVGNHIPANTPVENCLIYEEEYRRLCRR